MTEEPLAPEDFVVGGEGPCRADAPSAESGSPSGSRSPPIEQLLSSLVQLLQVQTAELANLNKSMMALAIAAEHAATACMVVVDSLTQQEGDDDDAPRDLLGNKVG